MKANGIYRKACKAGEGATQGHVAAAPRAMATADYEYIQSTIGRNKPIQIEYDL